MVEMLIIFIVMAFMVSINLLITNKTYQTDLLHKEKDVMMNYLSGAKQLAINSRDTVSIKFNNRSLFIQSSKNVSEYKFKSIYFTNSKELYFNKKGNLNQAYTVLFKHGYKYHKLIFYLGKGWFKIE